MLKNFPVTLAFFLIIFNILLSTYWLINGDIHYDVDVSRDLLVIDDIVKNGRFTLLGPRSGAIPGIFHGPAWFYLNLPIFLIGHGNPIVLGWFWFFLSVSFLGIIFWVARKLFDTNTALFSTLLLSVNSIINPSIGLKNFYNPYGAVFLAPLFFWWFYQYITKVKTKYLLLSLFTLGLIIQFQMAFGIPILIAVTISLIYLGFRKKMFTHFSAYLILLLPLSTFVIFDLRHNWIQLQAVKQYLSQESSPLSLETLLLSRLNSLIFDYFKMFFPGENTFTVVFTIFFIFLAIIVFKKATANKKVIYQLFFYLLTSFWIVSLAYQGGVGNYFWPFLPLMIIIFCSFKKFLNKKIFMIFFTVIYLMNFYVGISAILSFEKDLDKRGPHSWAFNQEVAKKIYHDAGEDFGYYNYSPDRFAFQQRYAMIYVKKFFPEINSFSSTKKNLTYLIEVDPPLDRPDLSSTSWRISDIQINRSADKTFRWEFIQVEKYRLDNEEIKIPANPNLSDSLFFR